MKMHPKPFLRASEHVAPVTTQLSFDHMNEDTPVQILFSFEDNRRQRLVMTKAEAASLAKTLAKMAELD